MPQTVDIGQRSIGDDQQIAPVGNVGIPQDLLVPLARQSALAGCSWRSSLLPPSIPELRVLRPAAVEGRYHVLVGLPQVLARPQQPSGGRRCADPDFRTVYRTLWS